MHGGGPHGYRELAEAGSVVPTPQPARGTCSLPSAGQNIHPEAQASRSAKAPWSQATAVMTLTKNILSIVDLTT